MKKSKRPTEPTRENGVDIISNLPDPILHLILSRLPTTEEAIRTSILSTRWRYLWTSVSSLDIDCSRGFKPPKKFKKNKFKEFMYWVLLNKSLHLVRFRLFCWNYYNMSTIGRWIHAAVMRKVRVLDLMFCPTDAEDIELPHCLVTCDSLVSLRLFLFNRPLNFPNFTDLSALRVLELSSVELSNEDLFEDFLESCPSLEDLILIDCLINKLDVLYISCPKLQTLRIDNLKMVDYEHPDYDDEGLCGVLQVSCPKLRIFEYVGHIAYEFIFENLDSLKKAVIYPDYMLQKDLSFESLGDTICELFAGLCHAESLSLNAYFLECINVARDPNGRFPASLHNLKTLEITTTIEYYTLNVIVRLLIRSPNLESLSLIIEEEQCLLGCWKLDEVETRKLLTRHLKRVEFLEFNGEKPKLAIIEFLLKYADALEEMIFSWRKEANYNEKSTQTMQTVSKFHKASSTVKLVTLLKK